MTNVIVGTVLITVNLALGVNAIVNDLTVAAFFAGIGLTCGATMLVLNHLKDTV